MRLELPSEKHEEMHAKVIKEWSEVEDIQETSP
jgi:hypothetical protein